MLDAITMQKPPIAATPSPAHSGQTSQDLPSAAPTVQAAKFISPRVTFDRDAQMVITQVRDRSTGEVTNQYPAESIVKMYKSTGQASQPAEPSAQEAVRAVAAQEGGKPGPGATAGESAGTDFSGVVQSGAAGAGAVRHASIVA